MWTYRQATGELDHDGALAGTGYAGSGPGKNNPAMESVHNTGPVPRGTYTLGPAQNSTKLGPNAMALIPAPGDGMFGRSGFFMHPDSIAHPGDASEGCIVMPHAVLALVAASADRALTVVS